MHMYIKLKSDIQCTLHVTIKNINQRNWREQFGNILLIKLTGEKS